MQHVLVAVDFSAVAERVLELAASLARSCGAQLTLVHVAAPDPAFVGMDVGPDTVRSGRARELRAEHRDLQARAETLRQAGLDAKALLIEGPTVEKLVEEARRLGVDAIVVGSHGHGLIHRALVGSTTEGLIRSATCPVVVVPAAE
jgi:nucleotide-binding universal stress UspA family protein